MKLEGMDAARVAVAAAQIPEPPYGDAGSAYSGREAVDHSERSDYSRKLAKVRTLADRPAFDRQRQQEEHISEKVIKEALDKANRILSGSDRRFEISIHEKTKEIMVKVVDTVTNQTIREIPPKKIVDIVVNLCEIAGIIFDKKG
jgi:flagellar protein FlaG